MNDCKLNSASGRLKRASFSLFMSFLLLTHWAVSVPISIGQVQDETKIELSGFSISESFQIADGKPVSFDEPGFRRIVYRAAQTSSAGFEQYSRYSSDVSWDALAKDPPGFRMQVLARQGDAIHVSRLPIPNAEPDEGNQVYRVLGVTSTGERFQVIAWHCPAAWLPAIAKGESIKEPISFRGFFYGMAQAQIVVDSEAVDSVSEPEIIPTFVARNVSWFPTTTNETMNISPSHVLLAQHAVDIAGLDFVRREDRKPLGHADSQIFFQFLTAVDSIGEKPKVETISHMDLLRNPSKLHGRMVSFQARVRKCSKVNLAEPAGNAESEFTQYFQLMVFPDLRTRDDEPTSVEIGKGESKQVYSRFPFTICCRSLPDGMTPESIENQQIWIDGFYFRFWNFDSQRTQEAKVAAQISPIIITKIPVMVATSQGQLDKFFGGLMLILVATLAISGWISFRIFRRGGKTEQNLPEKIDYENFDQT